MLNDDWTNWVDTEREARDWKVRFGVLLQAAKKNIEALSQIIEADDRIRMRLAAGKSFLATVRRRRADQRRSVPIRRGTLWQPSS
jgi:hypothetical protein